MNENPYKGMLEEKAWDKGAERYFDMSSEGACADTLYTYLSRLHTEADRRFGSSSLLPRKIFELRYHFLQMNQWRVDGEFDEPMSSLYLIEEYGDPMENDENWLQPFERNIECNA